MDLTVITPTLNAEAFLPHCIASTQRLRALGAQHIVVDSGSTDSTVDIAKRAGLSTLYVPPGNMYAAVNQGARTSKSDWLTYINSDDSLNADAIIDGLNRSFNETDIIYGNIDYVDMFGRFLHYWRSAPVNHLRPLFASRIMPLSQQGTMIRRRAFDRLGGFSERTRFSSDFDFFLRAVKNDLKFVRYQGKTVAAFRLHQAQISQNYTIEMHNEGLSSLVQAGLTSSRSRMFSAKTWFRIRNFESYLVRLLRYHCLTGKWSVVKTMSLS